MIEPPKGKLEFWRPIKGYEGKYEVSDLGRVKMLEKYRTNEYGNIEKIEEKLVNQSILYTIGSGKYGGYYRVGLNINGESKSHYVHSLVATAFCERKEGKDYVNHIDLDKLNNDSRNLEWVTAQENTLHWMAARKESAS